MVATGTAKRYCTGSRRKIRWDRVVTCALIPVMTVCLVQSIARAYTNSYGDAKGDSDYGAKNTWSSEEHGNVLTTQNFLATSIAETHTTAQRKQIVVDEKTAGFKLKLKSSASSMGIEGLYFSKKLGHVVSVRELQILMMLVLSEGALEPYDAQVGIAATVLNRVQYEEMFPNTIEKVVVQPFQFSPVVMKNPEKPYLKGHNGFYIDSGTTEVFWEDYPECIQDSVRRAVYEALDGTDPTECVGGALYYCNMNVLTYEEMTYRSNIGESITYGQTTFYREW